MTDRPPGLSRRDFLRLGLVAGPASLVAACGWDGGPLLEPRLRPFSRLNDWVGEKILLSPTRLAPEYPTRRADAERRFPAYSITCNRAGHFPRGPAAWCAGGGRPGARARTRLTLRDARGAAADHLYGEAPLRGGLDRDRHLDRRAGRRRSPRWCSRRRRALSPLRLLRQRLLQRLGPGERACTRRPSSPTPSTTGRSSASAARRSGSTRRSSWATS